MNAVISTITEQKPLESVVHEWMQAKHQEDAAKARRLALEERILALNPAPEEGSATRVLDNGFKLTLTGKLSYKCDDLAALLEGIALWPENLKPVKTKIELDETGCKFLRKNEPGMWSTLAQFVTVQPAKTAVKVGV
jgi:hypothetical protein